MYIGVIKISFSFIFNKEIGPTCFERASITKRRQLHGALPPDPHQGGSALWTPTRGCSAPWTPKVTSPPLTVYPGTAPDANARLIDHKSKKNLQAVNLHTNIWLKGELHLKPKFSRFCALSRNSYTPRTLRACYSQSKFRILKIQESSARALFLYNCSPNISRSADANVSVV